MFVCTVVESTLTTATKGISAMEEVMDDPQKKQANNVLQNQLSGGVDNNLAPHNSLAPVTASANLNPPPMSEAQMQVLIQALRDAGNSTGNLLDTYA